MEPRKTLTLFRIHEQENKKNKWYLRQILSSLIHHHDSWLRYGSVLSFMAVWPHISYSKIISFSIWIFLETTNISKLAELRLPGFLQYPPLPNISEHQSKIFHIMKEWNEWWNRRWMNTQLGKCISCCPHFQKKK